MLYGQWADDTLYAGNVGTLIQSWKPGMRCILLLVL